MNVQLQTKKKIKTKLPMAAFLLASSLAAIPAPAHALTGTAKLACEAVLCLSSSVRPGECTPSLTHYFKIDFKKLSDTIKERKNFLNQCPWDGGSALVPDLTRQQMASLIDAISRGAGLCDAEYLNTHNVTYEKYGEHVYVGGDAETEYVTKYRKLVNNWKPDYCEIYENHEFTDLTVKYIGSPKEDGFWVDGKDYDAALEKYNAEQKLKEQQNDRNKFNPRWPW